ncbi:UPF0545 protein C22orf39 homolog [Pectinophora gossypiella]|uniref:Synaptic plasticity regulator PANTS n=1 Tax=Pectinophora gossypiella TaxID=13191 RepID=A0A1E1WCH5_PECGO|nr:UPF0545 protein C22orf39 homolog [Pectinophora gossypiella]
MSDTKENTAEAEETQTETSEAPIDIEPEDKWLIRDCDLYKDEYDECTSFRGRFHQYFIFGETLDCNQWKRDYDNCCKWVDNKDIKAAEAVIKSERLRRLIRLRGHMKNDTWKKRESPPSDWDRPLPEWMVKRDENTYLAQKAKEMREGTEEAEKGGFCSIM